MFSSRHLHPFAVEAFFARSLVLTFTAPAEILSPLLPPCLELDTFNNQWGFAAMAMVQTRHLRPKGFPEWMGNDFFLVGYRLFVKYHTSNGKRLRGLYILKSQTDQKKMERLGNFFTKYNYSTTDIQQEMNGNNYVVESKQSGFHIEANIAHEKFPLPAGSPFSNWKEARRFAGPLPFTFSYVPEKKSVLIVEGVREDWEPRPVEVINMHITFPEVLQNKGLQLANSFVVENIPYSWKKGKLDPWTSKEPF
jgi:hypothetical protein